MQRNKFNEVTLKKKLNTAIKKKYIEKWQASYARILYINGIAKKLAYTKTARVLIKLRQFANDRKGKQKMLDVL